MVSLARQNHLAAAALAITLPTTMTAIEESLLQTLVKLDETVKSMANAGSKPDLLPIFSRLDQLARQLPPGTAPDLLHYLHKKSYEKARLWLENRNVEIQRGSCHPKT